MSAERQILHIDMDAFYASVEQLDDPSLRGKPVLVGGHSRRGVVMARLSIEGETFGISNVSPFALSWDTRNVADGEYLVESEALSNNGAVLARTHTRVFVLNHKPAVASSTSSGSR